MKHTKEYAQKLADERAKDHKPSEFIDGIKWGFVEGYLSCLEETAAPDLLSSLEMARETLIQHGFTTSSSTIIDIDKAIKKATL